MLPDIALVPRGATLPLPENHCSVGIEGDSGTHHVETREARAVSTGVHHMACRVWGSVFPKHFSWHAFKDS